MIDCKLEKILDIFNFGDLSEMRFFVGNTDPNH